MRVKQTLIAVLFFLGFLVTASPLQAKDKILYGFERLAIHDYFRARESFQSAMKKHPVPAYYGLSIISSRNNNPFYNLDSARIFILTADTFFHHLTAEEETKLLTKYKIGQYQISTLMDSIASQAFSAAETMNTVDAWNTFIDNFRWSLLSDSGTNKRNELAFSIAKKENTSNSYRNFFTLYPYSTQLPEAKKRYDDCLFREQVAPGTEEAFASFITHYPDSPYRFQAEDSLYAVATRVKSPAVYYAFAKKYPANKNTPAAWMKLYHRYLEINPAANLNDFFGHYPDFKYRKQVEEDFRLSKVLLLPARKNNHYTFITEEGRQIIPNLYDDVDEFSEGLCAVSRNGKYGYINKSGKIEIDYLFDEADPFEDGFALVKVNGKASVINRDGEMLVEPKFDDVSIPHDNRILFLDSVKYGYMDTRGNIIIPAQFEIANDFSGGMAIAGKEEDELGIIDRKGQWVLPPKYTSVFIQPNGLIRVEENDQFGLLNRLGDAVIPVTYDAIGKFSSGLVLVAKNEKFGYADVSGRLVIPLLYDFDLQTIYRNEFNKGFAEVKEKGKSALIDSTGNKVISFQYEDLICYDPAAPIAARKKNKWGFIDMENKILVPFKYDQLSYFSEDLAVVKSGKFFGAIDRKGATAVPAKWDFITAFKNSVAVVKKDNGFGLISNSATILVDCAYEKYQWVTDIVIRFERNGRYGYFNSRKKEWIWKEDGL